MRTFAYSVIAALFSLCAVSCLLAQQGQFTYLENKTVDVYDPLTYDPNPVNDRLSSLLFSSLFTIDEEAKPVPDMVEKWEKDKSKKNAYIFTLKKGLKWKDGSDVTAQDVVFTIGLIKERQTQVRSDLYLRDRVRTIASAEYIEKYKFQVTFASEVNEATLQVIMMFPLLPKKSLEKAGSLQRTNPFVNNPVGCGPFYFDNVLVDYVQLKRNADYHRKPKGVATPIQAISMIPLPDDIARISTFLSKRADMLIDVPWTSLAKIQGQSSQFRLLPYESLSYNYIAFNFRNDILKIHEIREACSRAIEREEILSKVYYKHGDPISGPFPPASQYVDPTISPDAYDSVGVRNLLKAAGCIDSDGDGILEYKGAPLRFRLVYPREKGSSGDAYQQVCEMFKGYLRQAGIDIILDPLSESKWFDKVFADHDFDLSMGRWRFNDIVGNPSSLFASSDTARGKNNYIAYVNPEVDDLFRKFSETLDVDTKKDIGRTIHRKLAEERPYIFLWSLKNHTAYNRKKLSHVKINPFNFFDSIYDWSIK